MVVKFSGINNVAVNDAAKNLFFIFIGLPPPPNEIPASLRDAGKGSKENRGYVEET